MWADDNYDLRSGETAPAAIAVLALSALLASSCAFTWFSGEVGDDPISYTLLEIPLAPLGLGIAVAVVAGGALAALGGRAGGLELAGTVALAVALTTATLVVMAEIVASVVPTDIIPLTARRTTLELGAGAGAWLALITATAAAMVAAERVRARARGAAAAAWARGPASVAGMCGMLAAAVALIQLRQETWVDATALERGVTVDGVALPWIAPITLVAVWMIAGGAMLAIVGLTEAGALIAAGAGWLVTASAGTTVVLADAVSGVDAAVAAKATAVTWSTLGLGLGVAGAAALLLAGRGEHA